MLFSIVSWNIIRLEEQADQYGLVGFHLVIDSQCTRLEVCIDSNVWGRISKMRVATMFWRHKCKFLSKTLIYIFLTWTLCFRRSKVWYSGKNIATVLMKLTGWLRVNHSRCVHPKYDLSDMHTLEIVQLSGKQERDGCMVEIFDVSKGSKDFGNAKDS